MPMGNKKKIYAILWVDDWSSFPLSKADIQWFHQNAGPLSLGIEMDERLPRPFKEQFRQLRNGNSERSYDYLSHHYHSVRWKGSSFFKKIHDSLRIRKYAYILTRALRIEKWAQQARMKLRKFGHRGIWLLIIGGTIALAGISFLFYNLHWAVFAAFMALCAVILAPMVLFLYVQLQRNWQYSFSDAEWNRKYLRKLKQELQEHGGKYPSVLRHGWELPPAESMEFYATEMNVLADASASPTPEGANAANGTRRLFWRYTEPYYASLSKDYDVVWDGLDEEDRGIIEMPANLGNITDHGLTQFARDRMEQIPEGGLVSVYIHGWDNFTKVKDWVTYLNEYYDVTFVRADDYINTFMKKNPRPVIIDSDFNVSWALKREGELQRINDIEREIVSINVISNGDDIAEALLNVDTEAPVPEIGIVAHSVVSIEPGLPTEEHRDITTIKNVTKGTYHLVLRNTRRTG
jgi:hypothetical protein